MHQPDRRVSRSTSTVAPIYNLFELVARFRPNFQWFRLKWTYLFRHEYHPLILGRNLPWSAAEWWRVVGGMDRHGGRGPAQLG